MDKGNPSGSIALTETTLEDDASKLSREPGSYEFWNFIAYEPGFSIGMIFNSSDFTNPVHRKAVREHREDPATNPAPNPADYPLLQLTVMAGQEKVFFTLKNPAEATTEFAVTQAYGRIGESTFRGTIEEGVKIYRIHIDCPDMDGKNRLEADIEMRALSPGFTVAGDGIYGRIPGGRSHQWQHVIGYPTTSGTVRVRNREGDLVFQRELSEGGGYCDHLWGDGFLGNVVDAYHCGKLELGPQGSLFYVWLTPHDRKVAPFGYVYRIPKDDRTASLLEIAEFVTADPTTGGLGLEYFEDLTMKLEGGGQVNATLCAPPHDDWWFQIMTSARFSASIPGDIDVADEPGVWSEYFSFPQLDHPQYCAVFDSMNE